MGGVSLIFSMKRFLLSLKEGSITFFLGTIHMSAKAVLALKRNRVLQFAILWFLILLLISALLGQHWTTALFSWLLSLFTYWAGHILKE